MFRVITFVVAAFVAGLIASCVAVVDLALPEPTIHLTQVSPRWGETIRFRGPVAVEYELTVFNPSDERLVLRGIDLRSVGRGAYRIRTETDTVRRVIPPRETVTLRLWVWGSSRGGDFSAFEPVTIRGIARFETRGGAVQRVFFETVP